MANQDPKPIKYSVHKTVTSKVFCPLSSKNRRSEGLSSKTPSLVRFSVTDCDATDSSGDECENGNFPRVKKIVNEVRIEWKRSSVFNAANNNNKGGSECGLKRKTAKQVETGRKFRGVRQRPWGRWSAEIRDPSQRRRVWLGTYNTAEEAALVYDRAAIRIRGPGALTNYPNPPEEKAYKEECCKDLSSPTSVFRFANNKKKKKGMVWSEFEKIGAESEFGSSIGENGGDIEKKKKKKKTIETKMSFIHDGGPDWSVDDCLPLDQRFLNDYFDFRSPTPLIYDEISMFHDVLEEGATNLLSDHEFESLTWDVNEYLEDQNMVV